MRPVDSVGEASPDDAACLRFSIIREQTIPCTARTDIVTNDLYGAYREGGAVGSDPVRRRNFSHRCQQEGKNSN